MSEPLLKQHEDLTESLSPLTPVLWEAQAGIAGYWPISGFSDRSCVKGNGRAEYLVSSNACTPLHTRVYTHTHF